MVAVGSPLFRFMAHCRGLPPAPITRAPSPQGVGSQKFRGRKTAPSWLPPHCPKDYSLLPSPQMITAAIEPGEGRVPRLKPPALPWHYGGSKVGRTTALRFCAVSAKAVRLASNPPKILTSQGGSGGGRCRHRPRQPTPHPKGWRYSTNALQNIAPGKSPLRPTQYGRSR